MIFIHLSAGNNIWEKLKSYEILLRKYQKIKPYNPKLKLKIKMSNPDEIEDLLSADQYREIISKVT